MFWLIQVFPAKFNHSNKVLPGNVKQNVNSWPRFIAGILAEVVTESPAPEAYLEYFLVRSVCICLFVVRLAIDRFDIFSLIFCPDDEFDLEKKTSSGKFLELWMKNN